MKITDTNKAIIKEGNNFSKMNFKKSSSGPSIYKTSSPAGIENEREFFCIKMRAFAKDKSYQNS